MQIATHVIAAAAGGSHILYVDDNGTLWGAGYNEWGQLFVPTTTIRDDGYAGNQYTFMPIASHVTAVAAGGNTSLYRTDDGTLWENSGSTYLGPVKVATDVIAFAVGGWGYSCLCITSDGQLWKIEYSGNRTLIAANVTAAVAGDDYILYTTIDGQLWSMGDNLYGQLGNGTCIDQLTPVPVASSVAAIAAGNDHSLYITRDGKLMAMGSNSSGQLGLGSQTGQCPTPVRVIIPSDVAIVTTSTNSTTSTATTTETNVASDINTDTGGRNSSTVIANPGSSASAASGGGSAGGGGAPSTLYLAATLALLALRRFKRR